MPNIHDYPASGARYAVHPGVRPNPVGMNLPAPPDWYADALCAQVDGDLFFPEKGGSTRDAKMICRRCPVRDQCLDYALANEERFGIWGGHSERERRAMNRRIA